jgi:tyrosyl-tRNA synthetase
VFEKGGMGDDLPTLTLTAADLGDGLPVVQLITRSGLTRSGKEARRLITDNGARLNDQLITDTSLIVSASDLGQPIKLSAGKKRHALVVLKG